MASEPKTAHRNPPGTPAKLMYSWPAETLEEMESSLDLMQYLQQCIRSDARNVDAIVALPEDRDANVWIYEHMRQFIMELNDLVVELGTECSSTTCPKMTADTWEFLCACHTTPRECDAMSYMMHALENAQNTLTSEANFPSRVMIDDSGVKALKNLARRTYRLFAHAAYHHKHLFARFEEERCLCKRFHAFSKKFDVMDPTQLIVKL